MYGVIWFLIAHLTLFVQVKEELEVFDNCPSFLVYSHPAGTHKTFHKVTLMAQVIRIIQIFLGKVEIWTLSAFLHSSKFSQKIKYVYSLTDLAEMVPMEYVSIPDCIKQ